MSQNLTKNLLVGLDIGTSKVVAVVVECLANGSYEVIGKGEAPSRGMREGIVVNIEQTVNSIQQALEEAELMGDCKIKNVITGIGGNHINSFNSSGMVAVADKEVSPADVARVLETAKAVNIPTDHDVLHVLRQQFTLDKQEGIQEPVGMAGIRLEIRVHIVTGSHSAAQNIVKCVRRCGLEVDDLILQPLAASLACLTQDERDLGTALIDIGAGTTEVAIWYDGSVRDTAVMAEGGDNITNDIAGVFRVSTLDAEDIKLNYGTIRPAVEADQDFSDFEDEVFHIQGLGDRTTREMSKNLLSQVIEAKAEELLMNASNFIASTSYPHKIRNVVLTGGTARLPGMQEFAEDVFGVPVRIGVPLYDGQLSDVVCQPQFSTVMGLVEEAHIQEYSADQRQAPSKSFLGRLFELVKKLF